MNRVNAQASSTSSGYPPASLLLGGLRGVLEVFGCWCVCRTRLVHLLAGTRCDALLLGIDIGIQTVLHFPSLRELTDIKPT